MSVPKASRLKTYSVLGFGRLHQERMTAKFLAFLSVEGNYQNIKTVRKKKHTRELYQYWQKRRERL